jgi:hypothetical protein
MSQMLSRRLAAFSAGSINDIGVLAASDLEEPLQGIVVLFANGSPRDMIRVCQHILSQQLHLHPDSEKIGVDAIVRGISVFSDNAFRFESPSGNPCGPGQRLNNPVTKSNPKRRSLYGALDTTYGLSLLDKRRNREAHRRGNWLGWCFSAPPRLTATPNGERIEVSVASPRICITRLPRAPLLLGPSSP